MTTEFDPLQTVREVTAALRSEFPDRDPQEIERLVAAQVEELEKRPVHDYVSVLAKRAAKARLKAGAAAV